MGWGRSLSEFGVFQLGLHGAEKEAAVARYGFPEHIVICLKTGDAVSRRIEIADWLPDNTIDDYMILTRPPHQNLRRQPKQYVYCFQNHRDAMNFKIRWG